MQVWRYQFQPDDRSDKGGHEKYTPEISRFMKKENANQGNADGAEPGPDRIRSAQRQCLRCPVQKVNTQYQADQKTG